MLCAELVNISWKDGAGKVKKGTAILENISVSGACLQLEKPLAIDTPVAIHIPRALLKGDVRYCVYRDIGYFVGLQFEEGTKWSRRLFQPQHMLDLQRLLTRAIKSAARRGRQQESIQ
jgi:hypothetical protein